MAKVYGIDGDTKARVEVPSKEEFDAKPNVYNGVSLPDPADYKEGDVFILTES